MTTREHLLYLLMASAGVVASLLALVSSGTRAASAGFTPVGIGRR